LCFLLPPQFLLLSFHFSPRRAFHHRDRTANAWSCNYVRLDALAMLEHL
jgi:hypothetical protein